MLCFTIIPFHTTFTHSHHLKWPQSEFDSTRNQMGSANDHFYQRVLGLKTMIKTRQNSTQLGIKKTSATKNQTMSSRVYQNTSGNGTINKRPIKPLFMLMSCMSPTSYFVYSFASFIYVVVTSLTLFLRASQLPSRPSSSSCKPATLRLSSVKRSAMSG